MRRNIFRNFSTFSTFRRCIALLLTVFLLSDTVNQYVSVSAAEADIEATDEESYMEDENVITVEIGEDGTVTADIDSLLTGDINNSGSDDSNLVENSTGSGDFTESVDASGGTEPDSSESSDDMENSDSDTSEETETEAEIEIISFESTAGDVTITVSGDTETLADVSEISVTEMDENRVIEYNDILSEIEGYEESEAIGVYDITLLNEDGEATEPSGTVTVTFTSTALIEQLQERDELTVFHNVDTVLQEDIEITPGEQELPEVKAESLEIIDTDITVSEGTLVFETDAFSEYALVLTGNDSQVESQTEDEAYMEFDKYLVEEEEKINNQSTYTIYLENAYYDSSEPEVIITYSPKRQDIILVVDHSSSIGPNTIAAANEGLLEFFNEVKELNQERMTNAKAGMYCDIDPSMSDSKIEDAMSEHLLHVTCLISYNSTQTIDYYDSEGITPLTDSDVATLYNYAELNLGSGLGAADGNMNRGTITYAALDLAYEYMMKGTPSRTNVILLTDGLPNRSTSPNNDAINSALKIKNAGATMWGIYERYGDTSLLAAAFASGNINDIPSSEERAWLMGLISSDYPSGGYYNGSTGLFTVYSNSANKFGVHTKFVDDWSDLPAYMDEIAKNIERKSSNNETGYAGADSYFIEEVTDPFEITDETAITVYQVPRIPVNLDDNDIPTSIDENGVVTDGEFRWGERSLYEWEDITKQVDLTVIGNTIKVTGYDYEANAVTDYDKDYVQYWTGEITDEEKKYESGDYGYKLVLVVGINAKTTFGGNGIATNNSKTTAFYPSTPQNSDLPEWTENTKLNPEGNKYIEKYPVPTVDLVITYDMAYDNMVIYAPQTAELLNLVTNENGELWYADENYSVLKATYDSAYSSLQDAIEALDNANDAVNTMSAADDEEALMEAQAEAEDNYEEMYAAYEKARDALSKVSCYKPDGINNAFVDIVYTLYDPNGTAVGTLTIPHGTEYYVDDSGNANLEWEFTQDNITTSGTYTIKVVITPVDTTASPTGHVYVTSDNDDVKEVYQYSSTQYSSTGSSATGSQGETPVYEYPTAYIFQLKITAKDTRLEHHQTLDFYEGNENLLSTENPHLVSCEWVCTDGVTESNPEDEPGITGLLKVGGGVTITSQIPEQAEDKELVTDIMGTVVTNVENGEWIPVSVLLSRLTGNLNKSADEVTQVTQTLVYMKDDDNLYGDGISSVIWAHECNIVDDCDDADFTDAQYYSTAEDSTGRGKVRYLIHVLDNPNPDIEKTTSTPVITVGDNIKWNIVVSNDNQETNENQNSSAFTMVDILPYVGDGRIDPDTNHEGSAFGGDLYYVSIVLDSSKSEKTLELLKSGEAGLYYTDDITVRTTDIAQIMGTSVNDDNIKWEMADFTIEDTTVTFIISADADSDAVAVKFVTTLLWEESLSFDMTANVSVLTDQSVGDYYHNQAFVTTGNGQLNSEVVATTVISPYISGTVWEDSDFDGLMLDTETRIEGVSVTIYREYNKNNSGTIIRTIDGINLEKVYDNNGDEVGSYLTKEDGYYIFDNLPAGTYYIVVDLIPDQYEVTKKQAGADDSSSALIDSEAEESLLTGQDSSLSKSAWIKEVTIATSVAENENVGLINILGSITIGKTLNEIYFPTTMTDEEQADYKVMFEFQLTGPDGTVYTDALKLDKDTYSEANGEPQVYVSFEDLPLGTYTLTEMSTAYYEISDVSSDSDNVSYNSTSMTATITLTSDDYDISVRVDNEFTELPPPGGDGNGVENWINMRIPVSLEIIYVGDYTISSTSLTSYTFVESDFDPALGGDIIVTYDDGTTISLSAGTLDFDDITLSPGTVTNVMNSDDPTTITGYYSEKGRTLRDSYQVIVDLKPVHKFILNFDANYIKENEATFDDLSTRNSVYFGYDEINKSNYVISGTYKDVSNGGLTVKGSNYTFAGWNTKNDGTGTAYSSYDALTAIGKDSSISALTLYANWKTYVTFDARGGTIPESTCITNEEKTLAGKSSGTIKYNVNQTIATGMIPTKENYIFVSWNTKADGTGKDIANYGKITGPVTFYAIYYQYRFTYTGGTQTFTAPYTGTYTVTLYGGGGGADGGANGGVGGYITGTMKLTAGQKLTVTVASGGQSSDGAAGTKSGGYNGGGSCYWSGGGGGRTDIKLNGTLIAAAAGAGGATHGLSGSYMNARAVGSYGNTSGSWQGQSAGDAGGGGAGYSSGGKCGTFEGDKGACSGYGGINGYNSSYFTMTSNGAANSGQKNARFPSDSHAGQDGLATIIYTSK